jgi:hypothetical protein
LTVFLRCSLGPSRTCFALAARMRISRSAKLVRDGRFARALKNSQLTCGDVTIICETVH